MEQIFKWVVVNWPQVVGWVVMLIIVLMYIAKLIREQRTAWAVDQGLTFLRELAKEMQKQIRREDVVVIAGGFYDRVLAGTVVGKALSRSAFIEMVWEGWQQYVQVKAEGISVLSKR